MGSIRGRLRNLEREAEAETVVLILQDTGEEIRVPYDAPLRYLVAEWSKGSGKRPVQPDPVLERLEALVPRGLREKHPDLDGPIFSRMDDARRAEGGA